MPMFAIFIQLISYLIVNWVGHYELKKNPVVVFCMYDCCTVCTPSAIYPCKIQLLLFPTKILPTGFVLIVGTCKLKAFRTNNVSFSLCGEYHVSYASSLWESHPGGKWAQRKTFPPFSDMKVGEVNSCSEISTLGIDSLLQVPIPAVFSLTLLSLGPLKEIALWNGTQSFEEDIPHTCQDFFPSTNLNEIPSFLLLHCIWMDALLC